MTRRASLLAFACAAALAVPCASPAAADGPLPPEARRRAEQALALGLLEEVEVALFGATTDDDRFPLLLRDRWWRPAGNTTEPAVPKDPDSLRGRRTLWLLAGGTGPYPAARAGETDPFPLVTLLVLDRQRRETEGSRGLLEESPLRADAELGRRFLTESMGPVLRGEPPAAPPGSPAALELAAAHAERKVLAARNQRLAAAGIGGLLAVAAILSLWARPRRRGTSGGGASGGGASPA